MSIACPIIAYSIYPVLSKRCKTLAISAVGFRTIEGALTALSAITLLALVPIAKEYAASGSELALSSAYGLLTLNQTISPVLGIIFSTGALMHYIGFFKSRQLPLWISIWGIIAAVMHIVASILVFYGYEAFSPINLVLNMPIVLQEMVMAVYLIIFGYREGRVIKTA